MSEAVDDPDLGDLLGEATASPAAMPADGRELAKAAATATRALAAVDKAERGVTVARKKAAMAVGHAASVVTGRDPAKDPDVRPLLPAKDKIRIARREDDGKLIQVNDYNTEEIAVDGDITAFVNKRLRPTYGDFDYVVYTINAAGEATPHSTIPRRENRKDEENSTVAVLRTFVNALQQDRAAAQPARDPVEEMQKLLAAVSGSKTDPMTLMMIPMLREAMKSMGPTTNNSEFTSVLSQVLDRLDRIERERREPPAFPVLPSMPAEPPAPAVDVAALVNAIASAVKPPPPPPQESSTSALRDLVDTLARLQPQPKPGITIGEILGHLTTAMPLIRSAMGLDLLQQQLASMSDAIKGQQSTALAVIPKSIGEQMREVVETKKAAMALLGVDPTELQRQGRSGDGGWGEVVMHMWNGLPDVIEKARGLARDIATARRDQGGNPALGLAAAEEPEVDPGLAIPEDAAPLLQAMEDSQDADETIQAVLGFLQKVSAMSGWRKYATLLVFLAKNGRRERVLVVLKGILDAMVASQHLSGGAGQKVFDHLRSRIDDLVKILVEAAS